MYALYAGTNGDGRDNNTHWFETLDVDSWYGINVKEGHVDKIFLNGNNLAGGLSDDVFMQNNAVSFSFLELLSL